MPEDIAADRLATPLVSPLLARTRAATGRVNLAAEVPGLLRVDTAKIDRLNTIDESLTIGTLPDYAVVAPKDLVATVKIIPFSVPGNVLAVAEALVRQGGSPLTLHPFHHLKVGLVVTELPGLKDSVTEKTIAATEQRVTQLTGSLLPPLRCAARGSADRQGAGSADRAGRRSAAGGRRLGGGGPARRRPAGHRAGRRRDPAFRHAGRSRQPDLPRPHRHAAGAGAARLRAQPEAERHRLRADPAVRRPAGGAGRDDADGRRRPAEGDRHAARCRARRRRPRRAPAIAPRSAPTIAAVVLARRPVAPHGAAQQAAGRRPHRQADDRPRGGQRAVVQRAAGAGGDRPPGRAGRSTRWAAGRCVTSTRPTTPRACPPA